MARHPLQKWTILSIRRLRAPRRRPRIGGAIGGEEARPIIHLPTQGNDKPMGRIRDGIHQAAAGAGVVALEDDEGGKRDVGVVLQPCAMAPARDSVEYRGHVGAPQGPLACQP